MLRERQPVTVADERLGDLLQEATDEELALLEQAVQLGVEAGQEAALAAVERRLGEAASPSLPPVARALTVELARRRQDLGAEALAETLTEEELEQLREALRAGTPVAGVGTELDGEPLQVYTELERLARARRERWARGRSGLVSRSLRSARARSLLERRRQAVRVARPVEFAAVARVDSELPVGVTSEPLAAVDVAEGDAEAEISRPRRRPREAGPDLEPHRPPADPRRRNSNGDIPMLDFTEHVDKPTLRLLILHDDAEREFAYTAGAEKSLDRALAESWTVVSIQNDWSTVFA